MEQAIFLLAGRSSRFEGIVPHKCLLRLAGQTVLERQITQAANMGVRQFVFGLGASEGAVQWEVFTSMAMRAVPYDVVSFVFNHEFATTGSWTTLWLCMKHAAVCDTIVFEGDIVTRGLPPMPSSWDTSYWLVVDDYEGSGSFVLHDEKGRITQQDLFSNKLCAPYTKKSAGIFYLCDRDAAQVQMRQAQEYNIIDEYLVEQGGVQILEIPGDGWWELDDVEDFAQAREGLSGEAAVEYHPDPVLL